MPIEDLLALYGYDAENEQDDVPLEEIRPDPLPPYEPQKEMTIEHDEDQRSISSEGSQSRASTAPSLGVPEDNGYDPFRNQRITRGCEYKITQYILSVTCILFLVCW